MQYLLSDFNICFQSHTSLSHTFKMMNKHTWRKIHPACSSVACGSSQTHSDLQSLTGKVLYSWGKMSVSLLNLSSYMLSLSIKQTATTQWGDENCSRISPTENTRKLSKVSNHGDSHMENPTCLLPAPVFYCNSWFKGLIIHTTTVYFRLWLFEE